MGAGKSLGMTIFTWYYSLKARSNVMSNLPYRPEAFAKHKAQRESFFLGYMKSQDDFIELTRRGGGIVAWDEMHQSMDSRSFARKTQIYFTQFMMYCRKIQAPVFFTSQSIQNQMDVRIRQVIDLEVVCSKSKAGFKYELWDPVSGIIRKRIFIPLSVASRFYGVFDTRRIIRPVEFPATEREYITFLDRLEAAVQEAGESRQLPLDDMFAIPGEEVMTDDDVRAVPVFLPVRR